MPEYTEVDPGSGPQPSWTEVDPNEHVGPQPSESLWSQNVSQAGQMGETLAKDALNIPLGLYQTIRHPFNTLGAIATKQGEEGGKAIDDFKKGDYWGAGLHGLGYAVPVVGPMLNETGSEFARGETGKGSAHAMELLLPGLVEEAWGAKVKDFFKVSPETTAAKAWTPTPSQDTFLDNIKWTGAAIKKYGNAGKDIVTNEQAIRAATKANKVFADALDSWIQTAKKNNAVINGNEIVKATFDALPDTLKREDPAKVNVIMKRVREAYGNKNIPVEEANRLRSQKTADLRSFYDQTTGGQIRTEIEGNSEATLKAQRDAIAEALYRALDPANGGQRARAIGQREQGIIDILDAARRRRNQAAASKPQSGFAATASAAPRVLHSMGTGTGMGYVRGAELMNPETLFHGSVDPWVRKFFKSVPDYAGDIPTPEPFKPAGLLSAPPKRLGPWMTESGPEPGADIRFSGQAHQPYMGRGVSPEVGNRMLPPASQTQVPGFATGPGTGAGTMTPGTGAIDSMVPVQNPATGLIEYVPEWYRQRQGWTTAEPVSGKPGELLDVEGALGGRLQANDARPFGRKLTGRQERTMTRAANAGAKTPPPASGVETTGRSADPISTRVAKLGSRPNAEPWRPPQAAAGSKPVAPAFEDMPASLPTALKRDWEDIMKNFHTLIGD